MPKINLYYVHSTGKSVVYFDDLIKAVSSAETHVKEFAKEKHPDMKFDKAPTRIYEGGNGIVAQAHLVERNA